MNKTMVLTVLAALLLVLGFGVTTAQEQYRPMCGGEYATLWVGPGGNGGTIFEYVDGEIIDRGDYFSNNLGRNRNLRGTDGNDVIVGSSNNDRIFGLGGDDILCGLNAQDLLRGGEGNDILFGGDGDDRLFGEEGDDMLYGEQTQDRLFGGEGTDYLNGGENPDRCNAGPLGDSFTDSFENCERVSPANLVQVARQATRADNGLSFSILLAALNRTGLSDTIATTPNLTVFAPTDEAFEALADELGLANVTDLLRPALLPITEQVLLYHVLSVAAPADVVLTLDGVNLGNNGAGLNLLGDDLIVEITPLSLDDARAENVDVIVTDVFARNGVIHVIDEVLLPQSVLDQLN